MVEVPMISRDSRRLKEAEDLLQTYKWVICKVCSLVDEIVLFVSSIWYTILNWIWYFRLILYRLETVDLRRMTNEEKIAFWVNIHNALLMHVRLSWSSSLPFLSTFTCFVLDGVPLYYFHRLIWRMASHRTIWRRHPYLLR
jgi:hypothetical protein